MATNRPTRKAYRPKPIKSPLGFVRDDSVDAKVLKAFRETFEMYEIGLLAYPTDHSFIVLSSHLDMLMIAYLRQYGEARAEVDPDFRIMRSGTSALKAIDARTTRGSKLYVGEYEAAPIRNAVEAAMRVLPSLTLTNLKVAQAVFFKIASKPDAEKVQSNCREAVVA